MSGGLDISSITRNSSLLDISKPPLLGGGLLTGIAQLVEHRSPKPRVVGSSPPSRANNIDYVEEDCRLLQGLLRRVGTQDHLAKPQRVDSQRSGGPFGLTDYCVGSLGNGFCLQVSNEPGISGIIVLNDGSDRNEVVCAPCR